MSHREIFSTYYKTTLLAIEKYLIRLLHKSFMSKYNHKYAYEVIKLLYDKQNIGNFSMQKLVISSDSNNTFKNNTL